MHQVLTHFDPKLDPITRKFALEKMTEHERDLYNLNSLARSYPDRGELARWWDGTEQGAVNGSGFCIEMVASRRRLPEHPGACPATAPRPAAVAEAPRPLPPAPTPIDWVRVDREKAEAAERDLKARAVAAEEAENQRIDESVRRYARSLNGRPSPAR